MFRSRKSSNRAFTLVEMIVSLAVFSIVAVVALGALTKIVSANRKAQTLQTSITNLNFALDTMSRELGVSPFYSCSNGQTYGATSLTTSDDCTESGNANGSIIVLNSTKGITGTTPPICNALYAYIFAPKASGGYDLKKSQQSTCGSVLSSPESILDPNVTITGYYLKVTSVTLGATPYPLATIRISGYTGVKERDKTYFDVQTSVAPHVVN